MKSLSISGTAGGFFLFSASLMPAQKVDTSTVKTAVDSTVSTENMQGHKKCCWLWRHAQVTGGQITLPFKIRKNLENHTFRLTTDVTLGGYIGYTRRLASKKAMSLTIPLTAGLTFINVSNNNTTLTLDEPSDEIVPGLTWSTGIVLQLEQYSLGLMVGKDYAGNVGDQWQYHGKLWWSFGIGFVFLK